MMLRTVWAPRAKRIDLLAGGRRLPMRRDEAGEHRIELSAEDARLDYAFSLDGGDSRPDPRSRYQPNGVHRPSRPVDHGSFRWTDQGWRPPPLSAGLIYELHIGTFTPAGSFNGAIEKLDYLRDLGVTHVELMPVAEFSGERGWGYDGVDLFAPHHSYGGPEGLKRLVDAAHARGLAVLLDVVYNHFGPDGAYHAEFAPYFTERHRTPWGSAINLDDAGSDHVRRFFCANALSWLRDYHLDGLRIDAVHAIFDTSAVHFLEQLASEVRALEAALARPLVLIAESDLNQPRLVTPVAAGGYGLDVQWNDEFHHALHALLTGEHDGYYSDFGRLADFARVLANVFAYDGRHSQFRGRTFGRPVGALSYDHFVGFIQNHDQVGNRAKGERIGHLIDASSLKLAAAALLTGPFVPMLFEGEEWSASSPFQYFTDFADAALGDAVRKGRRAEFAEFHASDDVPDPQAPETFRRSKLKWEERDTEPHREIFDWYRALIRLRRDNADFRDPRRERLRVSFDEEQGWLAMRRGASVVVFNFAHETRVAPLPSDGPPHRLALASAPLDFSNAAGVSLPGRSVAVLLAKDE